MGLINPKKFFIETGSVVLLIFSLCWQIEAQESLSDPIISERDSVITYLYKEVGSVALELTVFPSKIYQSKSPAILFFFGGGWRSGSIDQFAPHARYFSQRGLTAILADYRVSSRHKTTPFDAVDDARDAVHYIFQNADKIGIDTEKIVFSGGSAGGHLALMSAFSPINKQEKPAVLVLFNPVIDTGPIGYGFERLGNRYKWISPVDNIPENPPPMILFLGTQDRIIDVKVAENFCAFVERNHSECKLKLYPDQKHGFFNYRNREYFLRTVREADRFLNRYELTKGEPNGEVWLTKQD